MRCRYRETMHKAGDYADVILCPEYRYEQTRGKRRPAFRPSSKGQEYINQTNAEMYFTRLVHKNFTSEDCTVHFTYAPEHNPADDAQAKRDIRNFWRRVNTAREKAGLPTVKYVYSFGRGSQSERAHFHAIMNGGQTANELTAIWGKGYLGVSALRFDENGIAGLAVYLCRQGANKKKWVPSKNLEKPDKETKAGRLSQKAVNAIAKNPDDRNAIAALFPGYYVPGDGCRVTVNPYDGRPFLHIRLYKQDAAFLQPRRRARSPAPGKSKAP